MTSEGEGLRSLRAWRALARPAPAQERFSGPVLIHDLNGASESAELEILAVFFEAGARTVPHTHSTGQLLYFLDGEGVVGTEHERIVWGAGSMAYIEAGRWHWHGATPTTAMCHLSIRPGGPSDWPPDVPMLDWETYMSGVRGA